MKTVSYVFYDADSGEIVHVHVQPVGLVASREEIMQMVGPGVRRLEVLELPSSQLPAHPVRIRDGELHPVEEDLAMAGGDLEEGFAEPTGERRYERLRPEA
jgi:hypothetical protein